MVEEYMTDLGIIRHIILFMIRAIARISINVFKLIFFHLNYRF
jgi:hypothetical protein